MSGFANQTPAKILVIRLSAIGDILLATPLLRCLRRRFPHAQIDFVVKSAFADLLRHHPALNHLYEVEPSAGRAGLRALGERLRLQHYDVVVDIHKNFRSAYLTRAARPGMVLRHRKYLVRRWLFVQFKWNLLRKIAPIRRRYIEAAGALGVEDDGGKLEIFLAAEDEDAASAVLRQRGWDGKAPLVALAPGAGFFTKRWPAEYFVEVARELVRRGMAVVLLGGGQDRDLTEEIRRNISAGAYPLAGDTSLLVTAAILKRCRALIANDSGLMHMAEAVGIPLVAIFGSTTKELGFFPQQATSQVIENASLHCRPCSHLGRSRCPKGHFLCMRGITPMEVIAAAEDVGALAQGNGERVSG